MTTWKCRKCKYVYDPAVGDPDGGIPPGTPFEKIPDSWRCPVCGAQKSDFFVLSPPLRPSPERNIERPAAAPKPGPSASPAQVVSGFTVGSLRGKPQP